MTRRRGHRRVRMLDLVFGTARPGEIYGYRTLRPSGRRPRHWGYVGKTRDGKRRHRQHMGTPLPGDRFPCPGQPWNDLDPRRYVLWRSRRVRGWRLALMEFLFVRITFPVYNDQLNRGNPRRISLSDAKHQRAQRDRGAWVVPAPSRVRYGFQVWMTVVGALLILAGIGGAILA